MLRLGVNSAINRSLFQGYQAIGIANATGIRNGFMDRLRSQVARQGAVSYRMYSDKHMDRFRERFLLTEYGLLDSFVPLSKESRPSLFSKNGYKVNIRQFKNWVSSFIGLKIIQFKIRGWKRADFEQTAESLYEIMNDAFAKGDRNVLEKICMKGMYAKLKSDMKNQVGRFEWKKVRTVVPPTVVQARVGKISKGMSLGQMVVKIEQEQTIAAYNKNGKLIAGDPEKPVYVKEYIVYQSMITDPNSRWQIYGRLEEGVN
ncbi:hypothetical protein H4219_002076 [Mycoemilia scoparia]|uniref:Large ribosomal subunit protein mL45 n=1 Tax=Mycoemilia scoparia TaxID=417184 RepID=A0A9W8A7Y2_9FUNG|nr:hypothetical protein H4219_002076 [Mycoemilia scoparia]